MVFVFVFILQVYLVDYGLAVHYTSDGQHRSYKEDPRKAHNGTVEFTSRDAHNGVGMWIFCCNDQWC